MVLMINTSQESRDKMGERGREKIENLFDEKIVINAYIDMINKIMDNEKTV
jgi:glycosyltransferase involved in cell wall biosynthesis